jgi:hypothetical protein
MTRLYKLNFITILISIYLYSVISNNSYAQDFLEIENAPTSTIQVQEEGTIFDDDLEVIDNLTKFKKSNDLVFKTAPQAERYKRPEKWKPKAFKAYLKRNSVIYKIDNDKQVFRVKRQLFILAEEKVYGGQYAFIYNNKGKLVYRTLTRNLVDVTKDLNLNPNLPSHEDFAAQSQLLTTNKSLRIENSFYIKLDTLSLDYYNDLFDTEGLVGTAERYEYRVFPKWDFAIDFGLTLSKEIGISFDSDNNQLFWSSYHFGPAIKHVISENDTRKWEIYLSFQKSFNYTATHPAADFTMTVNSVELELLWKRKTKWGVFILGGNYRQQYMSLDAKVILIDRPPSRATISALGLSLGYEFSFNL